MLWRATSRPTARVRPFAPARAAELEPYHGRPIIVVCRAGVRSTTAAAMLYGLGYERVYNLKDGMVDWNDRKLPVER